MSRIVRFSEFGPPSVLEIVEQPEPHAGPGQVRVAVKRAGLNPVDSMFRNGWIQEFVATQPPSGLGSEFAGVIDEVAGDVGDWRIGDEVFGGAPFRALADHLVVDAADLARKPPEVPWEVIASAAVAGSTGLIATNALEIRPDDTVLVSAAAGGVGGVASQLAVRAGATVIGTASEPNHEYLRSLDIIPVNYGPGLTERVREVAPDGITAAMENNRTETIEAALELGVVPARITTVVGNAEQYGVTGIFGSPDAATLREVAGLLAAGDLTIPIQAVYPLDDIVAAYGRLDEGHLRGKIVTDMEGHPTP